MLMLFTSLVPHDRIARCLSKNKNKDIYFFENHFLEGRIKRRMINSPSHSIFSPFFFSSSSFLFSSSSFYTSVFPLLPCFQVMSYPFKISSYESKPIYLPQDLFLFLEHRKMNLFIHVHVHNLFFFCSYMYKEANTKNMREINNKSAPYQHKRNTLNHNNMHF